MGSGLNLESLPVEILLQIQHYLPTHAAALFSLTSKSIWRSLGVIAILELQGDYREITEVRKFLLLLERDIPDCFACHECLTFHSMSDLEDKDPRSGLTASIRLCRKSDIQAEQTIFGTNDIHYMDLRRIMQTQDVALRRAGIQQLSFRTDTSVTDFLLGSNRILMRGQHFIECDIGRRFGIFEQRLWEIAICNDIRKGGHFGGELGCLRNCTSTCIGSKSSCKICCTLRTCPLCPTDFETRLIPVSEEKYLFVLTRWLDLGNCTSPNEPFYRSHMTSGSFQWIRGTAQPIFDFESGTAEREFESLCQGQGILSYNDFADQYAADMAKKYSDHHVVDDLSWFKLDDS